MHSADDSLLLVAISTDHLRIELETPEKLAERLDACVSPNWPCGEYDEDAMRYFLDCLESGGESVSGWYGWYALRPTPTGRVLVGAAGYFGPPDSEGSVEIGYSILPEWRGRGLATALAETLVARAFGVKEVQRVLANTTPDNIASIRVLERCGFRQVGSMNSEGKLCFLRTRTPHVAC